ncbi:MAG: 6-pyruvoyl trahydropterin synthase family protein, partial [Bryobacteraceae bacterium]
HNYRVEITISGDELNSTGLLVDFADVKRLMKEVIERLDHQFINDVPPFDAINPSAENMAKYFYDEVSRGLGNGASEVPVRIAGVSVWETDITRAVYRPA